MNCRLPESKLQSEENGSFGLKIFKDVALLSTINDRFSSKGPLTHEIHDSSTYDLDPSFSLSLPPPSTSEASMKASFLMEAQRQMV